ncbi:MAG: radical SAM protein [Candidatus Omnitrophica bacterium]|nr:radical SAM protein [Candidatus Omnitrophota bacterium]
MRKIYFADLTYNDGILACDVMPLGSAYVAAYALANFGSRCSAGIFKYADEFFKLVENNPPDIFAGSCYVWNKNVALMASKYVKQKNPDSMIVFGGLAFPLDKKRQKLFLQENSHIDFLIPYDGEIAFSNLLNAYFDTGCDIEKMKSTPIEGVLCINKKGEFVAGANISRPKELDIFPSPHLTGLMDKFFNEKRFTPSMQTTRGCPHTCAYCWASNEQNRRIGNFSMDRIRKELEYISKMAIANNIYDLMVCDSNFGLYERDYDTVDVVYRLQQELDYPRIFTAPYGKAATSEHIKRISRLKGMKYGLAMQSTDQKVLEGIKRRNLSGDKIVEYINLVHSMNKNVSTEIITGLPHETRQSHMNTLRDMMKYNFDFVDPFTFMLLDGIELDSEEAHEKFKYDIRYRLIPRNFGKVNGKYSFEIEKVVVGTNSYNFEDYIYFRSFHGLLRLLVNNGIYRELIEYMKQYGVDIFDWLVYVFEDLRKNRSKAAGCFGKFTAEARSELWNSPEELIRFYSKEENYRKLVEREQGDNLMQKCSIFASSVYFDTYAAYFSEMAGRYLTDGKKGEAARIREEMADIREYILAKLSGVISKNIVREKVITVRHDILKWIESGFRGKLSDYKLEHPVAITFEISDDQAKLISTVIERYDVDENNPYGLFKTTTLVHIDNYFRKVKPLVRPEGVLK